MNNFEIITTLISVLAVVISTISLIRTRKQAKKLMEYERLHAEVSRRQLAEMDEVKSQKNKTSLVAEIEHYPENHASSFVIMNNGISDATNIYFSLTEENESNPIVQKSLENKTPYQLLRPGEYYDIAASFPINIKQQVFNICLRWSNADGTQSNETMAVYR
ncbi:hypothetical protein FKG94_28215 [Exilibacterium tricleocarpae]|uniref:Uncharacterized protein n=1 Tax=Exilibacterium tricleocarpae TaxID=2591008 RepID=A0A545SL28_9GAMM|nr:hypothetical protein [Exilibacterium tricleocarpae]TQV65687.1 hypothetical protein FKG94_28215 [Exilibacterium tricleocarpae]